MQYPGGLGAWNTVGCAGISEGSAIRTTQLAIIGTNEFVTYQDRGAIVKEFNSINATLTVTVTGAPHDTICSGFSTILTATGATTYTWKPSTGLSATTGAIVTALPTVTTTYTVIGKKGTDTSSARITIYVNKALTLTPALSVICYDGPPVNLTVTGPPAYSWTSSGRGLQHMLQQYSRPCCKH